MPIQFWAFAAPCYCMLINVDHRLGASRWYKAFGEEFDGMSLPFGGCVSYLPSVAKDIPRIKWDLVTRVCVFVNYKLRPGCHWKQECLVWDLTDFADFNFSSQHPATGIRLSAPHVTGRVNTHDGKLTFPLKAA